MTWKLYEIRNLEHAYQPTVPVLRLEAFDVVRGSVVGLMGPNGSGKSTLLRLMGFVLQPTAGEILFKGQPAEPFSDAIRFYVSFMPQSPYLLKRTVYGNIAYGLKIRNQTDDLSRRIRDALAMVGLDPDRFGRRYWFELSGGEAQRVALAARLALKPEVLILDEPTSSVDMASAQLIREASIQARNDWGTTLVVASHDWNWLYDVCDDILHLFRGRPIGVGSETLISGPWIPGKDGLWEKRIAHHSPIRVGRPPSDNVWAMISPDTIQVLGPTDPVPSGHVTCRGIVSQMVLEKRTGKILLTIMVGNLPMTARVTPDQTKKSGWYPGSEVSVAYDPHSVLWV